MKTRTLRRLVLLPLALVVGLLSSCQSDHPYYGHNGGYVGGPYPYPPGYAYRTRYYDYGYYPRHYHHHTYRGSVHDHGRRGRPAPYYRPRQDARGGAAYGGRGSGRGGEYHGPSSGLGGRNTQAPGPRGGSSSGGRPSQSRGSATPAPSRAQIPPSTPNSGMRGGGSPYRSEGTGGDRRQKRR